MIYFRIWRYQLMRGDIQMWIGTLMILAGIFFLWQGSQDTPRNQECERIAVPASQGGEKQ